MKTQNNSGGSLASFPNTKQALLSCLMILMGFGAFAQFQKIQDGEIEIEGRTFITKDIGEIYTPTVYSYDKLNGQFKLYGCGSDFARLSKDDIGPTVLTEVPNGDWEMIVRVVNADAVGATGFAYKEIELDDGTGTGTRKTFYPGDVLPPQPRHTSNHRYGLIIRENLDKRSRLFSVGTGRRMSRVCLRKEYAEDEEGNVVTDARFTYSGGWRPNNSGPDYPAWLRVIKRGTTYTTYHAKENEEVSYANADEVNWTFRGSFTVEMDAPNIYVGMFSAPNVNNPFRGSAFDVRDPRITQVYDNFVLREAPPIWQLANPVADQQLEVGEWFEYDVTDVFDHDVNDVLSYEISSSDENTAFGIIENTVDNNGKPRRILKVKGIQTGTVKFKMWWDVAGTHLEDIFYIKVNEPAGNVAVSGNKLANHYDFIDGGNDENAISSYDASNGWIRVNRNAGGNNAGYGWYTSTKPGTVYFPMAWDGIKDSIEVTLEKISDSRFFGSHSVRIASDLAPDAVAAAVGQVTTVSGGTGWQYTYHYKSDSASTAKADFGRYPGGKTDRSNTRNTGVNKQAYRTEMKIVRENDSLINLYSRRVGEPTWEHYQKVIDPMGDYYFMLTSVQTRSGSGAHYSNLKINGVPQYFLPSALDLLPGESKSVAVSSAGMFGEVLGEDWSIIAIDAPQWASLDDDGSGNFILNATAPDDYQERNMIITAERASDGATKTLNVGFNMILPDGMDSFTPNALPSHQWTINRIGDAEYLLQTPLTQIADQASSDRFTYLFEEVSVSDSLEVNVRIDEFPNSGEKSKVGVILRSEADTSNAQYLGVFATAEEGIKFQYRWKAGLPSTVEHYDIVGKDKLPLPFFIKLRFVDGTAYPYVSTNGVDWVAVRKYSFPLQFDADFTLAAGVGVSATSGFGMSSAAISEFDVAVNEEINTATALPVLKKQGEDEEPIEQIVEDAYKGEMRLFSQAEQLMVAVYSQAEETFHFELRDINGRLVKVTGDIQGMSGNNIFAIPMHDLGAGTYVLSRVENGEVIKSKLFTLN